MQEHHELYCIAHYKRIAVDLNLVNLIAVAGLQRNCTKGKDNIRNVRHIYVKCTICVLIRCFQ
jgi:hypothetical protein